MMGCSITVGVQFGEGKNANAGKSPGKGTRDYDDDYDGREADEKRQREQDIVNKILAKHRKHGKRIDFVQKNMDKIGDWQDFQREKIFKIRTNFQRIEHT